MKERPESSSATAIRVLLLIVILSVVAAAFGYERVYVTNRMQSAADRLAEMQEDITRDHPASEVREAIGFDPVQTTAVTETYRWLSLLGRNYELNVIYNKKEGEEGRTLARFKSEPLTEKDKIPKREYENRPQLTQAQRQQEYRSRENRGQSVNPLQAMMVSRLERLLKTQTLEEIYNETNDKQLRGFVQQRMEIEKQKKTRRDICASCGLNADSEACCQEGAEVCPDCNFHKDSQLCCSGLPILCMHCGSEKGSADCCKEGKAKCQKCGFHEGSELCCIGLEPGKPLVYCHLCGQFKGSEKCCSADGKECSNCGYHVDSPLCKLESAKHEKAKQKRIDEYMNRNSKASGG